jgi:hypothetical protein
MVYEHGGYYNSKVQTKTNLLAYQTDTSLNHQWYSHSKYAFPGFYDYWLHHFLWTHPFGPHLHLNGTPHIKDCHTSFFPFSIFWEWGRGTLSLKGGGFILWRLRISFFSFTGEEWRMKKTSCAKVLPQSFRFSHGSLLSPLEARCGTLSLNKA